MPEISFILYKPAVPGNVGASARAMKTMGFKDLRLINPCDHLSDEARMLAHGSHDILESARSCESFEEAVRDLDLILATTAKTRSARFDYYSSRDLKRIVEEKAGSVDHIGIVFGTEESGLPNDIIQASDIAISIPMHATYPSLNLSQSVMVIAYELSYLNTSRTAGKDIHKETRGYRELKERTRHILERSGIASGTPLHHRIMERVAMLKATDIPLLHSITSKLETVLRSSKSQG